MTASTSTSSTAVRTALEQLLVNSAEQPKLTRLQQIELLEETVAELLEAIFAELRDIACGD